MNEEEFKALKDMLKKKDKLISTTALVHSQVYNAAVEEHLMDEDGKVDYDKLKKTDMQEKFADTMRKHYLEAAKRSLGIKVDKGELEEELLLKAYTGATSDFIKQHIGTKKHGYDLDYHKKISDELKGAQNEELEKVIYGKIKEKHIPELVKRLGIIDNVNANKMRKEDIIGLTKLYFDQEEILGPKQLENFAFYKKKDKKAA